MKEAVLKIYYTDEYKRLHVEPQGKLYFFNKKPMYLADMTPKKWWKNFSGYSISKQILDAFTKAKVRPQIIYRRRDLGTLYATTPTQFKKRGIFGHWGGHDQYVLPVYSFDPIPWSTLSEPIDLPLLSISDWLKDTLSPTDQIKPQYRFEGNKAVRVQTINPIQEKLFT